ncbi:MAG: Uma2 family endonuclease [Chloroflexi bacterium]|nr:Uma2 family endonuclease [Chloroflexota bacterium]
MATTRAKLMTAEELFAMPDDGYHHYELIRGVLRKMAPAGLYHGVNGSRIVETLLPYVRRNGLGEVPLPCPGFILERDPDHVREPDVSFIRQGRIDEIGYTRRYFPEAPALVVEVISPNDRYTEVREKVNDWLSAGTEMAIVVNPRSRTVQTHTSDGVIKLTESDTLDGGDVVPGWRIPVADIFA